MKRLLTAEQLQLVLDDVSVVMVLATVPRGVAASGSMACFWWGFVMAHRLGYQMVSGCGRGHT